MKPKNRFQETNSTRLCSLAGRYDNPFPTRFISPHRLFKNSSSEYFPFHSFPSKPKTVSFHEKSSLSARGCILFQKGFLLLPHEYKNGRNHGLGLFGLHVHSCSHWLRPRNPSPPLSHNHCIWAHIWVRYWSAKIDDISLWLRGRNPSSS